MAKVKAAKPRAACIAARRAATSRRKWLGRCPACQEWSTLVEELARRSRRRGRARRAWPTVRRRSRSPRSASIVGGPIGAAAGSASSIACSAAGWSRASIVLLGGDPGVGKSTLLIQALAGLARDAAACSTRPARSRSRRPRCARGASAPRRDAISIVAETDVERILAHAHDARPAILAVDSIQTVYTPVLDSIPGSLAQVRECASRLMQFAKTTGTPTILVGHVTKDGAIAGPKTLEHLVDVVLQLEGDGGPYRILRAHKNRFGSTQEIGVFEMRGAGHGGGREPVGAPARRAAGRRAGLGRRRVGGRRAAAARRDPGARRAGDARASAGAPRPASTATASSLLLAVLAQRASCDVLDRDVFVNVAGGVRLAEPAIDLGIACAIASSARGRAIDARTVVFGEVGLAGEIRAVTLCEQRLAEAARLGFTRAIVPAQNAKRTRATDCRASSSSRSTA